MNPALAWIFGIASSVLAAILIQYFYIPFRISQALAELVGKQEERWNHDTERFRNLRQDLQEAYEAISTNRDMHREEIIELRKDFDEFRVKVAAKTGINGR